MASGIANGMNYLHGHRKVAHLDLKSANVLMKDGSPKICDFGCSIQDHLNKITKIIKFSPSPATTGEPSPLQAADTRDPLDDDDDGGGGGGGDPTRQLSVLSSPKGTPEWMAPEISDPQNLSSTTQCMPADVYAFGIMCWELLTRLRPVCGFTPHPNSQTINLVAFWACSGERPVFPKAIGGCCPPQWQSLCEDCWAMAPAERPTFAAIVDRLEEIQQVRSREDWAAPARPCVLY